MEGKQNLDAARKCLLASLETSSAIGSALDESGSRLELLRQRCQSLQTSFRPISMQKCSFIDVGNGIDSVLCSAATVLKVFEFVQHLENSLLTDAGSDLCSYVSDAKKLEEALKLLTDNCTLAIGWLQGVLDFLQDKAITNEFYLFQVKKSLRILRELQAVEEGARVNGGFLSAALDNLETEFQRLLMANSMPIPLVSLGSHVATQALPGSVMGKLQAIIERLNANSRLDKCKSIYVEVRGRNAQRTLNTLDLSYLEIPTAKFEDVREIASYIDQWGIDLELVVKNVLDAEYMLSCRVFEKIGREASAECFARIAIRSGILSFILFGRNVSESRNDPYKLLNLLDIFSVLDDLRLKFNQLFGGKACEEIRIATKDLVNKVVNGACEIFWQLPAQVKLQRPSSPPRDGGVPRLVSFVTDYCNQLLNDTYLPHLKKVLEIHLSWRNETYEEGIVFTQIYDTIKEVAVNLDSWSKAYEDITLSYIFMMNNHCHFYNLRGTMLGDTMGDTWLGAHEQYKDYYAALYLRNSWGKLLSIIVQKDLLSSSLSSQDLGKRLHAFNVAFDERYKKESSWTICDEALRKNICKHLVECIVPIYKAYVKNYNLSIENEGMVAKHIKYTAESLENKIWSMFQPKLKKNGSVKHADWTSKIKQVSKSFRFTLAAK
ncbi:hypothetical protein HN51_026689 [Arachis hypogaea]|uniref:Exocyst subunit Exo70 family protein n=1 Tax=Arachis hypogaea TaxID=3818 RepID=A0A445BQQ4_ARAHY|nr:exocyst complex component EXO70A1 [Arachis hypogaea]QHO32900.1 Exocyst complex component [Arachis hypogaea]RYR41014.1 hypothetical protein Ahy_A09g046748 [Arachis hypogaea]